MDPYTYLVTALLNSIAYQHKIEAASVIPEPEFRPFNLSHLRSFPKDTEEDKNSFRRHGGNVSNAFPA
jgi:hypothetical protein